MRAVIGDVAQTAVNETALVCKVVDVDVDEPGIEFRACAQIDLTPKETFYTVEGIRMPNISFHNGSKTVTYTPPGNWLLSGGGTRLILAPRDGVQVGATIDTVHDKLERQIRSEKGANMAKKRGAPSAGEFAANGAGEMPPSAPSSRSRSS